MTPEIRELIGRQLQRVYGAIVNDPLPGRLTMLLAQLAASSTTQEKRNSQGNRPP
jgi:hypothetical protein